MIDITAYYYFGKELRNRVKKGHVAVVENAYEEGVLESLMPTIVSDVTINTPDLLKLARLYYFSAANFQQKDSRGNTLMHLLAISEFHIISEEKEKKLSAQANCYAFAIKILLQEGLTLEEKNSAGQTPLDIGHEAFKLGVKKVLGEMQDKHKSHSTCAII